MLSLLTFISTLEVCWHKLLIIFTRQNVRDPADRCLLIVIRCLKCCQVVVVKNKYLAVIFQYLVGVFSPPVWFKSVFSYCYSGVGTGRRIGEGGLRDAHEVRIDKIWRIRTNWLVRNSIF
jgi:hypothetical protein